MGYKYSMHCKFLDHGIALAYDQVVKPCCTWKYDNSWAADNQLDKIDISTWHQSPQIIKIKNEMAHGVWPSHCQSCQMTELQGRSDSMRGNGNRAYASYQGQDITLEIRPGSVCNFACQTCWPEASSRVAQYHHQAGIVDIKSVNSHKIDDFDFLLPVADRIRNVVLLGGEPFYDKKCLGFLQWAQHNLKATITLFTNGSAVDWQWIENYRSPITMVFSLDAVGSWAEYIRFGTEWSVVYENFVRAKTYSHVETRVNITTSVYNYGYLESLLDMLLQDWPSVVTFGIPHQDMFRESVVPMPYRADIIAKLERSINKLKSSNVEHGQQHNAVNALVSIVKNLQQTDFDQDLHQQFADFVNKMDSVKQIRIKDHCPEVFEYFSYNSQCSFDH